MEESTCIDINQIMKFLQGQYDHYPGNLFKHKSIMLMIQNNLDPAVAQHPQELITYGGNGAVFQNWAQYLLTMQYLSEMTDDQTLGNV